MLKTLLQLLQTQWKYLVEWSNLNRFVFWIIYFSSFYIFLFTITVPFTYLLEKKKVSLLFPKVCVFETRKSKYLVESFWWKEVVGSESWFCVWNSLCNINFQNYPWSLDFFFLQFITQGHCVLLITILVWATNTGLLYTIVTDYRI